jgi:GNAT superfamily N-acetyltransferase
MKNQWTIIPAVPTDEAEILACTQAAGVFSAAEVATVAELFAGYIDDPQVSGYNFLVCRDVDRLYGFACWGPTDLTEGTADLYWICTHPDAQGRGVARALFQAVESAVRAIGRWQIVIWTSICRHSGFIARCNVPWLRRLLIIMPLLMICVFMCGGWCHNLSLRVELKGLV